MGLRLLLLVLLSRLLFLPLHRLLLCVVYQ